MMRFSKLVIEGLKDMMPQPKQDLSQNIQAYEALRKAINAKPGAQAEPLPYTFKMSGDKLPPEVEVAAKLQMKPKAAVAPPKSDEMDILYSTKGDWNSADIEAYRERFGAEEPIDPMLMRHMVQKNQQVDPEMMTTKPDAAAFFGTEGAEPVQMDAETKAKLDELDAAIARRLPGKRSRP